MGKPTKILHNVAVGVVLNDVLDPLIAVLISATLRFSRMASSGLGNVDLSEVLFALENVALEKVVQLFLFEIETMGDRNFLACC